MIDAAAISRMHTGAVLVDVGRGGVVDEPALVQALAQAGWSGPLPGRRRAHQPGGLHTVLLMVAATREKTRHGE